MSATLASLVADVNSITKRPDLPTELHVRNALLKVHSSDYYLKDLFETNIRFSTAASLYGLDYKGIIPRFRAAKYLSVIDPITETFVRSIEPITIGEIKDSYGLLRTDVFYLAGSNIQIRLSDTSTTFGIGAYLYPDTTLATPSWIADEVPFAILYEAARTLFKTIGYDEQSTSMQALLAEAMAEVKMSGITTVGY